MTVVIVCSVYISFCCVACHRENAIETFNYSTKPKLSSVVGIQSRKQQLSSGQLILKTNLCIESLPDHKISAIVKAILGVARKFLGLVELDWPCIVTNLKLAVIVLVKRQENVFSFIHQTLCSREIRPQYMKSTLKGWDLFETEYCSLLELD